MTRSLVNPELTLFSYEILGLVGRGGAGAHDLLRMAQRGRVLAWAGESQYYVEPKRLARLGYLDARKEPGKTRERTVYALTDKGRAARLGGDAGALYARQERVASPPADRRPGRRGGDAPGDRRSPRGHRRPTRPPRAVRGERRDAAAPAQVPPPRQRFPPSASRPPPRAR